MNALVRLVAGLLAIVFSATFFGPAHRLLPSTVRIRSFGFTSLAVTFFGAAVLRHVLVAGYDLEKLLTEHALYFAFLLFISGSTRATELALYMAVSIGVDLVIAAVGAMGVDITGDSLRSWTLAWEFGAAAVAIVRLWVTRHNKSEAV